MHVSEIRNKLNLQPTSNRDFSSGVSSSVFTSSGDRCLTGISTSFSTSMAVARLSGSSYSAKPNLHGLSSASVALNHLLKFPAARSIRSIPSSPPAPSVIPPMNSVLIISSFDCGWMGCGRSLSPLYSPPIPRPARLPPRSRSSLPTGVSAFDPAPRRITGAAKFMLGIFAGG